jgi:5-methylcytosine-specific restriction endonuclease McrBC regulatory subunit McrC
MHEPLSVNSFSIRATDRPAVKNCKLQANKILSSHHSTSTAWRVDFNDVFEKFVQHIFAKVAQSIGGKLATNSPVKRVDGGSYALETRQMEPDAVLSLDGMVAFIDAKYKSHLYNKHESSELLRDDFRRDLHQVLAYTSFSTTQRGIGIICYPSNHVEVKSTIFRNPANNASNELLIVGVPLRRAAIGDAVSHIAGEIDALRRTV